MRATIILISIFFLVLSSCTKDKVVHPYAGTYDCEKKYNYYDNNGNSSDSTVQERIDIILINDSIDVLGAKVHQDSVEYGKVFTESYLFNYIKFRFEPDSIYIILHYGSSGSSSTTHYKGFKLD